MHGLLRQAGMLVVVACIAASIFVSIVPVQPRGGVPNLGARLQPPSWLGGRGDFLLGSDQLGREVLYRLLGGLRTSLVIGAVAATAAAVLGVAVGLTSGYA